MVTDVRVAGIVTTPAGTPNNDPQRLTRERVKLRELIIPGPTPTSTAVFPHLSKTGKRAFYRAVRRARLHGSTQYKGRTHTTRTLGATENSEPDLSFRSTPASTHTRYPPSATSRWRLVKWQTDDHFMIHSGNSNRKAGILIMIDRSFANAQAIRTHAHIPGRMVQIRIDTEPAIVVFALYQLVWGDSSAGEDLQRRREEVWSALHSAVRGTPWRAQLIIAGDFNTPCLPEPSLAGPGIPPVAHIRQTDQPRFQQLITAFDLNVLNTWQRRKHARTYRFPKKDGLQQTQIDFVLARACQVDAATRCARPLRTPFVPTTGMHHLPILVSMPRPARPRTPTACRSINAANLMLRDQPQLSLQFQNRVQQLLTSHMTPAGTINAAPAQDPAELINSVLISAWASVTKGLPASPKPTGVTTHSPGMVRQLWRLRHLRNHLPATCSLLRRWLILLSSQSYKDSYTASAETRKRENV